MRSVLFEIHTVSVLQAALVALAVAGGAALWAWRERRAERLTRDEFGKSLALGVGVAVFIALAVFIASRVVHPIRIRSYGVMLMLAFGAGIVIAMQRAPRYGIDPLCIVDLSLFILVGSIVGSRAFYVVLNWNREFAGNPRAVLNVWEGGLAFYGGLIGGMLGGWLFTLWRRVSFRVLADLVAPSIAFGYAVARLGCFLNGCCHGGPSHLPWAVLFPESAALGPVHPAQLYSALMSWAVGVALLLITPAIRASGHLFLWYLVLSSVERIITEVFRRGYSGDILRLWPALTQAQALSILLILVSLAVILLARHAQGQGDRSQVTGDGTAGDGGQGTGDRERRKGKKGKQGQADRQPVRRERGRRRR